MASKSLAQASVATSNASPSTSHTPTVVFPGDTLRNLTSLALRIDGSDEIVDLSPFRNLSTLVLSHLPTGEDMWRNEFGDAAISNGTVRDARSISSIATRAELGRLRSILSSTRVLPISQFLLVVQVYELDHICKLGTMDGRPRDSLALWANAPDRPRPRPRNPVLDARALAEPGLVCKVETQVALLLGEGGVSEVKARYRYRGG
ncbi:hypothetical protein JCM11491_006756 [Sporobolomyces phaffii]